MAREPQQRLSELPETPGEARKLEPAVLLLALLLPSAITYCYFILLADAPATTQQSAGGGLKLIQFALPVFWVGLALKQPISGMRVTSHGLAAAVAFGAIVATAIVVAHRPILASMGAWRIAEEAIERKVSGLGFISRGKFLLLSVFYTLAHSLLEEYYWRWFVFGRLKKHINTAGAIAVSSIGFMGHHIIVLAYFFGLFSPATWFCSLNVCIGGAIWAWLYNRSGYLFPIWISHAMVDAAIFFVGYRFLFSQLSV